MRYSRSTHFQNASRWLCAQRLRRVRPTRKGAGRGPSGPLSRRFGRRARCYLGGRIECRVVGTRRSVCPESASKYPTVFSLLNLWFEDLIPRRLQPVVIDPKEMRKLLEAICEQPRATFRQVALAATGVLCRGRAPRPVSSGARGSSHAMRQVVAKHRLAPAESTRPLWRSGPALAAAAIAGRSSPRIRKAMETATDRYARFPFARSFPQRGEDRPAHR